MKVEKPKDQNGAKLKAYVWNYTIYKHDASGNIMGVYAMEVEKMPVLVDLIMSVKNIIFEKGIFMVLAE